jgi:hypothetical protein
MSSSDLESELEFTKIEPPISEEFKEDNSDLDISYAQSLLGFTRQSDDFRKPKSKPKPKSSSLHHPHHHPTSSHETNNTIGIPLQQQDPYGIMSKSVALVGLTHHQENLNGCTGKVKGYHNLAKTYIIKLDMAKLKQKQQQTENNSELDSIPSIVHVPYENLLLLFHVSSDVAANGGEYDNDPNFEQESNNDQAISHNKVRIFFFFFFFLSFFLSFFKIEFN